MSKLYKKYILLIIGLSILISSCKKLLEIDPPKNELETKLVFSDSVDATSAVLGIYGKIMESSTTLNFGNGYITVLTGLASDEITLAATSADEAQFLNNIISPETNSINTLMWRYAYQLIYHTNACIEGLESSETLGSTVRDRLIGESKFMRAFIYFNLVNLYGDVPLILSTEFSNNSKIARVSTAELYESIVADLKDAQQKLPSTLGSEKLRPSMWSAVALLARVYLYMQRWQLAIDASTDVISSNQYILEGDLNKVFLSNSTEAIFQLLPIHPGYETPEGQRFIPTSSASSKPRYSISISLSDAFDSTDLRLQNWVKEKKIGAQKYKYPFKYKLNKDDNTSPLEYFTVLRFAEQYLIRAEASGQLDDIIESTKDLNIIRRRAGLPDTTFSDKQSLLLAIEHERQLEFFCEWGHRWYDLKRTGRANDILSVVKSANWQSTDVLWPIPYKEIEANPVLIQNPGY